MVRQLTVLLLLALGGAAAANVQHDRTVSLSAETAIAYDADGKLLFRADLAFLLEYVGTKGEIFEVSGDRVRMSPDGTDEVWLRCSEPDCAANGGGNLRIRNPSSTRGIPFCPGDPRCPKRQSK